MCLCLCMSCEVEEDGLLSPTLTHQLSHSLTIHPPSHPLTSWVLAVAFSSSPPTTSVALCLMSLSSTDTAPWGWREGLVVAMMVVATAMIITMMVMVVVVAMVVVLLVTLVIVVVKMVMVAIVMLMAILVV